MQFFKLKMESGGAFISAISVIGGDPLKLVRIKKDVNIIKNALSFEKKGFKYQTAYGKKLTNSEMY